MMITRISLLIAALMLTSTVACAAPPAAEDNSAAGELLLCGESTDGEGATHKRRGLMFVGASQRPTSRPPLEGGTQQVTSDGALTIKRELNISTTSPAPRQMQVTIKAPANYYPEVEVWQPWPARGRQRQALAVQFSPRHDEQGVPILGALFRQIITDSIKVTSADGSKVFVRDEDYKINDDYCQIMAIDGRLGEADKDELLVTYQFKPQRLDLMYLDEEENVRIIEGREVMVCPQLPSVPEKGTPVATLYWPGEPTLTTLAQVGSESPLVTRIVPARPVQPVNGDSVAATLKKLRSGQTVRIAFVGDSITLGAEAGKWWEEDAPHYRNQFLTELRRRFPTATIEEIQAFQGGQGAPFGQQILLDKVIGKDVDLLLIAFGLNDAIAAVGRPPANPPEAFAGQITAMTRQGKDDGIEVILLTAMQPNPYQKEGLASRIGGYNEALAAVATAEKVALADVYTQWLRLADEGIPPYSQLHNWHNHPGIRGHKVYADVLLRFFPQDGN